MKSVLEKPILEQLEIIYRAYNKASFLSLFKGVYKPRHNVECILLYSVSCIVILYPILIFSSKLPPWINNTFFQLLLLAILVIIYGYLFDRNLRKVFKNFYEKYPETIKIHSKEKEFLRYLIFKNHLLKELPQTAKIDYQRIYEIVEEYSKNNSDLTNLIFNHPFIVFILGLIGGIIVNSASIKEAWTSKMIPSLLVILFILLIFSISFFEIIRPRALKFQEIKNFYFG